MNPTTELHRLGQRLWLDNITCDLLVRGTLQRYVRDLAVSGLTANPPIFDRVIRNTNLYDAVLARTVRRRGRSLHARSGAAHCRRPRPEGRLGRVNFQPLGRGGLKTQCRRRAAATPAVGQHRDQGSGVLRDSLHRGAGGAGHDQHHAR